MQLLHTPRWLTPAFAWMLWGDLRWVRGEAVAQRCWRCWIKFQAMTSWAKTSDSSLKRQRQISLQRWKWRVQVILESILYIFESIILHRIRLISFSGLVIDPRHQVEISPILLCTVGPASQEHVGFLVQSLREAWNHVCKISFQLGGRQGTKKHRCPCLKPPVPDCSCGWFEVSTHFNSVSSKSIMFRWEVIKTNDSEKVHLCISLGLSTLFNTWSVFFFEITDRAGSVYDLSPELEEEHVTWWHPFLSILVATVGPWNRWNALRSELRCAYQLRVLGEINPAAWQGPIGQGAFLQTDEKKGGLRVLDFHFKTHQQCHYISNIYMEECFRWFSDSPTCREKVIWHAGCWHNL